MDVRVGQFEFDASSQSVFVGWCEFDATAPQDVHLGWCEFDAGAALQMSLAVTGGRGTAKTFKSAPAKSQSVPDSRYHGRHDADPAAEAELADEEAVLTLLMEIFAHAV